MATAVSASPTPVLQFFNNLGQPNVGGTLLTQVGGINSATYQDAAGTIPLPNPIPLNSRGEVSNASGVSCQLFLVTGVTYTFTLFDAAGNQLETVTSVTGNASSFSAATGSSLIGYTPTGTGSVARTVLAKLNDQLLSVNDFIGALSPGSIGDWVPYLNSAINYMNATGFRVFVPEGTYPFSNGASLSAITAGGFIGAGEGGCVFTTSNTNGAFLIVGNDSGAACSDVKLGGFTVTYSATVTAGQTPMIQVKNANRTVIHDIFFSGAGRVVWINGNNASNTTRIFNVRGAQALVNEDCFQLSNGNDVVYDYCFPYLIGVGAPSSSSTAGAGFAIRPAAGKSCDTFRVNANCQTLYLYDGAAIDTSTGGGAFNVWLDGIFDSTWNSGLDIFGSGIIQNVDLGANSWFDSFNGYAIRINPSGVCDSLQFYGQIFGAGVDGIYCGGTVTNAEFYGQICNVGHTSPGNVSAIVVADTAEALIFKGKFGGATSGFPTQTAQYGIKVNRNVLRMNVQGCNLQSTIKGILHFAYSTGSPDRICSNNSGDSGNLGLQSFSLPASTVAYTNMSPYQQDIFMTGGTVTVVAKNGTTLYTVAGNYVITLGQGETMTLTYTVAPTCKMFQR